MDETLQLILAKLDSLDSKVSSLEQGQSEIHTIVKEIDRKTEVIFKQTADLTEFTTSTKESLHRIETELDTLEKVTAKNCYDITHLKLIKK